MPQVVVVQWREQNIRNCVMHVLNRLRLYVHTCIIPDSSRAGIIVWTPIQYVTLLFWKGRGAASLRDRNRADITVVMCEQKPHPGIWFWYRSKIYPVQYEHLSDMWLSALEIGAAQYSLRLRNRADITVLMCEQKPYLVWFSYQSKTYPIYCEHNLTGADPHQFPLFYGNRLDFS